jgi:predicted ATPase
VEQLLEREEELATLSASADAAREGRGVLVLLRGEAGIGKTSLLRALRERSSLPFHVGRCEPLSVPEPLGPLRELAESAGATALPELAANDRRALARALQRALTEHGPAVAAVEDAHWADPASLDVLRVLARRMGDAALTMIVTFRDDQLASSPRRWPRAARCPLRCGRPHWRASAA